MTAISPTAAATTAADVIVLSTGDVRLPLHEKAEPFAPRAEDQPYRAPQGDVELRQSVAAYTARAGAAISADQVVVTPGARQAIVITLRVLLEQRPEVLLPTPYWTSYPNLIGMAGGTAVRVPGTVGDGTLDVAALDAHRTARTGAVVVNSPRNPDGAITPGHVLREVISWADHHGIAVLFDQVYRGVALTSEPAPTIAGLYPELPDHCVLVDGLTKSHALAGLRVGWAVIPPPLRTPVVAQASHLIGGTCGPAQDAALTALADDVPGRIREALTANLDRAVAALRGLPGLECAQPASGIFLFPDLRPWLTHDAPDAARRDLSGWLKKHHRVAVVDGGHFGAPGHIRLSFAVPAPQLDEGLHRLRSALEGSAQ
ncbi:aminotransferase class I/II-fold pyridoxal phosphate-dependent enzyme [Streptomyces griseus]|uniref:pyridoxal phosphate-dependent aminotransferase n=1 Tax=Streptomyces griseus TaxID=1911 RepID=UPI0004C80228|nr:aminotransferase class I/II-fold pyridoxal phosphate-dependent enzyme [Streptomyces griseus]